MASLYLKLTAGDDDRGFLLMLMGEPKIYIAYCYYSSARSSFVCYFINTNAHRIFEATRANELRRSITSRLQRRTGFSDWSTTRLSFIDHFLDIKQYVFTFRYFMSIVSFVSIDMSAVSLIHSLANCKFFHSIVKGKRCIVYYNTAKDDNRKIWMIL